MATLSAWLDCGHHHGFPLIIRDLPSSVFTRILPYKLPQLVVLSSFYTSAKNVISCVTIYHKLLSKLLTNFVGDTKTQSLLPTTTTTVALANQHSMSSYESDKSTLHRFALDPLFVVLVIPLLLRVSDLVLRPVTGRTAPTRQGRVARVREQT